MPSKNGQVLLLFAMEMAQFRMLSLRLTIWDFAWYGASGQKMDKGANGAVASCINAVFLKMTTCQLGDCRCRWSREDLRGHGCDELGSLDYD